MNFSIEYRHYLKLQYLPKEYFCRNLNSIDFNEICITSSIKLILDEDPTSNGSFSNEDSVEVEIIKAEGEKCERCWTVLEEVSSNKNNLCNRCEDVWKSFQQ